MKRKKRIIVCVLCLILSMFFFMGCGNQKKKNAATQSEKAETEQEERKSEEKEDKGPEETEYVIAAPSVTGALSVDGTQLVGSSGEPVQLKGISTHGLAWFPDYVNEECFRQLRKEWRANVIRLAMYTAESGGYCSDGDKEYLKGLIRDGVAYAKTQDLYVIIDWHILSDSNPNMNIEEAKDFFAELSEEYAKENHVLYEICNEPNGGTSWGEIKAYAEEVIGVIRSNDEDAVILVGTPNWSQFVDEAAADPITGYDNLMYTLHFYAATHTDDLRGRLTRAVEDGLPVFVSEYGICDASGNGAIDEGQAEQWTTLLDSCGISYVAWNLSNKDETSAIFDSSCSKVSGFTQDDLSESGRWLYQMLTAGSKEEKPENNKGEDTQSTDRKTQQGAYTMTSSGMEVTVRLKNSWEADGENVCQYDLTIKNVSGNACNDWEIELPFEGEFRITDSWNGVYAVEGNILHITSMEYNGALLPGESASDVGFIAAGKEKIDFCI